VPVGHRRALRADDDVVHQSEFLVYEERAVDRRDNWNLEIEHRERLMDLVVVPVVVAFLEIVRLVEAIAHPAFGVHRSQEAIAGAREDDALIVGIMADISKRWDERAVDLETPFGRTAIRVHPDFEDSILAPHGEIVRPTLRVVVEIRTVHFFLAKAANHAQSPKVTK
jgi:hypothetical protein